MKKQTKCDNNTKEYFMNLVTPKGSTKTDLNIHKIDPTILNALLA